MNDIFGPIGTYYSNLRLTLDDNIRLGLFWPTSGQYGALICARKLAWYLVRQGDILGALTLLINVRIEESYFLDQILSTRPSIQMWKRWRLRSKCVLWFYENLRRTLLFFGSL